VRLVPAIFYKLVRKKLEERSGSDTDMTRAAVQYFREHDTNGDGKLDKDELLNSLRTFFQIHPSSAQLVS
jgi:Ca2+-binding EF-hand superfamily protein